jgi:hypothetical protein
VKTREGNLDQAQPDEANATTPLQKTPEILEPLAKKTLHPKKKRFHPESLHFRDCSPAVVNTHQLVR